MKFHGKLGAHYYRPFTERDNCNVLFFVLLSDAIASITTSDTFTYNNKFSAGQLEEFTAEYHNYIDEKRREGFHHLNVLLGNDGEIPPERLRYHTVILVSDGLVNGLSLDVAYDYLKKIAMKKLIIATPFATVQAIDRMHVIGDEICCLDVIDNFISVDHYYRRFSSM